MKTQTCVVIHMQLISQRRKKLKEERKRAALKDKVIEFDIYCQHTAD